MINLWEQYNGSREISGVLPDFKLELLFKKKRNSEICLNIIPELENIGFHKIQCSYYVGVDWIDKDISIYVEPKLNEGADQTDYLTMLFSALSHPEIFKYTDELFEIKFDKQEIEIEQQQDKLTPLLVILFLKLVQEMVRKGLKKSYYRVEENLNSRIKGKVLVSRTIKENILKNKMLKTYCSYDEFGYNGFENRLIKKALSFVKRYMPKLKMFNAEKFAEPILNYINPAFENVSDEVNLNDVKHTKKNLFYKEYEEAIRLAKIILRRFGYNITNTENQTIKTPPFWIDMSKLFELYVLGMLKDCNVELIYQFQGNYGKPDFLLQKEKIVVDAKYKIIYQNSEYEIDNIRQISGYARDKKVLKRLNIDEKEIADCLIIYPDQINGKEDFKTIKFKENEIDKFVQFYKVGVKLPKIKKSLQK